MAEAVVRFKPGEGILDYCQLDGILGQYVLRLQSQSVLQVLISFRRGGFSTVFAALHLSTGEAVALKAISKGPSAYGQPFIEVNVRREIAVLHKLKGQNKSMRWT